MKLSYLISKLLKKINIPALKNSDVHKSSKVASFSHLVNTKIGKYSYVANYFTIVDTKIGNFCSIADNVIIGGASHTISWVSTSPVFHKGNNILKKNFSNHNFNPYLNTIIKNDVWIGVNCLIKSGLTIENGAVIAMGSVLTKNVGSYEIWAGNPAKLIKKRFSNEVIQKLIQSSWWNYDKNILTIKSKNFNNVEFFLNNLKEHNV